jgi:hypothetical protein
MELANELAAFNRRCNTVLLHHCITNKATRTSVSKF